MRDSALKANGKILFTDRPLSCLFPARKRAKKLSRWSLGRSPLIAGRPRQGEPGCR